MSCGSIYKIVFPNGKHYIGLTTTSIEQRTGEHKRLANHIGATRLYKALRKYDMVDTFELIEIDTADTIEELCEKEIGYIIEYNSYHINGRGYNMTYGGDGTNGYVFTEDDIKRISTGVKLYYKNNPNAGKEHSERLKKYYENPEAREENRARLNKYHEDNPDTIARMSERMIKYHEDNPEARKEQGKKLKQYYEDNPEEKLRNHEMLKKYWENPEARKEQSERRKQYYKDNPEAREENSARIQKYWDENPEAKQQMSEIKKKYHEEHPEAGEKHSEIMKKRFQDNPELGKEHSEFMKKRFQDNPELGKEHSERMKKRFQDNPELGKEHSERMKKMYENPEAIQRNSDAQKNRSREWIYMKLDTLGQNKPFDVFRTDGTFIKTFTYQIDALEYLRTEHNITSTISIGIMLKGRLKSSAGFVFKYK